MLLQAKIDFQKCVADDNNNNNNTNFLQCEEGAAFFREHGALGVFMSCRSYMKNPNDTAMLDRIVELLASEDVSSQSCAFVFS